MKRFVGLPLAAGILFTCIAASSGQAAPVSGAVAKLAPAIRSSGAVSQVYWRRWHRWHRWHRHCWWRHGYRHCW
jgi:hypothetical protein